VSAAPRITDLYERHAHAYDQQRGRALSERSWLDAFLREVPRGATVLDIGCGMGEPIAAYVIAEGRRVCGVDASASLIALCRERFPAEQWLVGDMRTLALPERFAGLLAWDSFFHLSADDQRAMFPRFAAHAAPSAALMFTSGPRHGEAIGEFCGEPLYHASLDPDEYRALLTEHGFRVLAHRAEDPSCGGHTVWLARYGAEDTSTPDDGSL
jgi:SAM-dependent methyltransferase